MICDSYYSHTYSVGNREIQTFSSDYCHDNTKYTLPNPNILRIFFIVCASGNKPFVQGPAEKSDDF